MNNKMKDFCSEKGNLNKKHSYSSSNISLKLNSLEINMNEKSSIIKQNGTKDGKSNAKCCIVKRAVSEAPKGINSKYGASYPVNITKPAKQHPLSKRKSASISNHLTNASAKVVLFERNVEIKDLESKVKYLQAKIKDLENENKTLQNVQSRQERELKKFKEGVADIPSLLRSHKEETKVYESTIVGIRQELRDCQKELKVRNEVVLKKEGKIDKLNVMLKQNEKISHDFSHEIKKLKTAKKNLEEENKILISTTTKFKRENDELHMEIKDLYNKMEDMKKELSKETELNKQLKIDLEELQQKHEDEKDKASKEKQNEIPEDGFSLNAKKENASEIVTQILSEDESKKIQNSLVDELGVKVLKCMQPVNKTKEALIHTFKHYQDLCDAKLTRCSSKVSYGIKTNNLKLLPPLKQPCKRYFENTDSDILDSEFSSFVGMKSDNNIWKSDELLKDFQHKLNIGDYETDDIFEHKISSHKEAVKDNNNNSFRELSKKNNLLSEF